MTSLKENTQMFSDEFLEYIKLAENEPLLKKGTNAVHRSPEGGNDTIGYGHKLTDAEKKAGKVYGIPLKNINAENAEKILMMDLMKRDKALSARLGKQYEGLDQKQKEMLLDFEFNVGNVEKQFPNFTNAVISGDMEGALKEAKRYYTPKGAKQPVELTRRNQLFEQTFFSPSDGEATQPKGIRVEMYTADQTPPMEEDTTQSNGLMSLLKGMFN